MSAPKRKRLAPAQRTEEILSAARSVVLEHGVANVTMERIAQVAGVSKGLLYAYFPNVTTLLKQVYVNENQKLHEQHAHALAAQLNFEEMVKTTWQISRHANVDRRLLVSRLAAEPTIMAAMVQEDRHNRAQIQAYLARQIVKNFHMPLAIAECATALALGYDEQITQNSTDENATEEIWAAMIVGAMKELEHRFPTQKETVDE